MSIKFQRRKLFSSLAKKYVLHCRYAILSSRSCVAGRFAAVPAACGGRLRRPQAAATRPHAAPAAPAAPHAARASCGMRRRGALPPPPRTKTASCGPHAACRDTETCSQRSFYLVLLSLLLFSLILSLLQSDKLKFPQHKRRSSLSTLFLPRKTFIGAHFI